MIHVVADANVAIKWFLPSSAAEQDQDRALMLLEMVRSRAVVLREPPHWLAEVAAVLSRLAPATAHQDIEDLCTMRIPIMATPKIYATAIDLAVSLNQHLFDTLYHAVALDLPHCTLITADERYYKKARNRGGITLLRDFNPAAENRPS